jgi:hypothetical protein
MRPPNPPPIRVLITWIFDAPDDQSARGIHVRHRAAALHVGLMHALGRKRVFEDFVGLGKAFLEVAF